MTKNITKLTKVQDLLDVTLDEKPCVTYMNVQKEIERANLCLEFCKDLSDEVLEFHIGVNDHPTESEDLKVPTDDLLTSSAESTSEETSRTLEGDSPFRVDPKEIATSDCSFYLVIDSEGYFEVGLIPATAFKRYRTHLDYDAICRPVQLFKIKNLKIPVPANELVLDYYSVPIHIKEISNEK